jgi:hypothetical protein
MRIQDSVLDCIAFLYQLDDTPVGTAFIIGVPVDPSEKGKSVFVYLVTAKHVALRIQGKPFTVIVNGKDGERKRINCGKNNKWVYHMTDSSVDAAITSDPFDDASELDIKCLPFLDMVATPEKIQSLGIGIGDAIFSVGLFARYRETIRNWPIVRTGSIAMMPTEKVPIEIEDGKKVDADIYLIEARSVGGISGSPVFVRPTSQAWLATLSREFLILGLMQGHWDLKYYQDLLPTVDGDGSSGKGVNTGIAYVVPAYRILEILMCPEFETDRKKIRTEKGIQIA